MNMNPYVTAAMVRSECSERWIKYYSSSHDILLVGEGDFSFSLCLALSFGSATNIVATTLDSYEELIKKYKHARHNLIILETLGACVLYGVDATQMSVVPQLRHKKFNRIIYNFPHAGFHRKEDDPSMISMHRDLVRRFLLNASCMMRTNCEIHVNHKTTAPFDSWRIQELGTDCSLVCIGQDEFRIQDYPGYTNKRGSGPRADDTFPLGSSKTYRFAINHRTRPRHTRARNGRWSHDDGCCASECRRIFRRYLNHMEETYGDSSYDVRGSVMEAMRHGYRMYAEAGRWRSFSGYTRILEELHYASVSRYRRLRDLVSRHGRSRGT